MPFATDRREKMFTAANLNSLYNRFDQKVYRTLNGVSPLMSNSTSGVWQGLYPYGVWYVYRTDPDTCKRLKDNGDVPSPSNPPSGCRFHPRCPVSQASCSAHDPQLEVAADGHGWACAYPLAP